MKQPQCKYHENWLGILFFVLLNCACGESTVSNNGIMGFAARETRQFLPHYKFKSSEYILVGLVNKDGGVYAKEFGNFILDDIETLKSLQADWRVGPKMETPDCGYSYEIYLLKNGNVIESMNLGLEDDCGYIAINGEAFIFEETQFSLLVGKTRSICRKEVLARSMIDGRAKVAGTVNSRAFVFAQPVLELEYDGYVVLSQERAVKDAMSATANVNFYHVEEKLARANPGKKFLIRLENTRCQRTQGHYVCKDIFKVYCAGKPIDNLDTLVLEKDWTMFEEFRWEYWALCD